jgi:carboxyl-terminal processing protease
MAKHGKTIRYSVAFLALAASLVLSIQLSDRGLLFEAPGAEALRSQETEQEGYNLSAMRIFNQVLLQMRENYVDPERIDHPKMLAHALDRIQNTVPEVIAVFNEDLESNPTEVEISVRDNKRTFDMSGVNSQWRLMFKMREILGFLEQHIDTEHTDLQDVEYAAVNGMLEILDPHSVLLPPKVYERMRADNRGSFGGLGIVISIRDGQLTVMSPIDDTPAGRAGFKSGDKIVKINDESTINMPLDEAVQRLRGEPGTQVTVEVAREDWSEPHAFELTREIINIESVSAHSLDNGIGYVQLRNFQGNTHSDLISALDNLKQEAGGDLNGLILDMRNNPGGLMQQAVRVADTFLREGTIVTTVGLGNSLREQQPASPGSTQPDFPMVVLVNSGSASASEIVAAALKNHNRAIVVGDVTFGKGSVQNIFPYDDGGALKLTIAEYLTPGGSSVQGVGIVPDILLVPAMINDSSVDLYPSEQTLREGDLESSLVSDNVEDQRDRPARTVRYLDTTEEPGENEIRDPDEFNVDFEIDFARRLLSAANEVWERSAFLGQANGVVEEVVNNQNRRIQEQLRQRSVDWRAGQNVIQPVSIDFTIEHAGQRVSAGNEVELKVQMTNDGERPLHQVRAVSTSNYEPFNDLEFVFGRLEPGQTRTWTVPVETPIVDQSRYDTITLHAYADEIDLEREESFPFEVAGVDGPHWAFSWWIDDSEHGNGDGLLQVGERVDFSMRVTNTGAGDSGESLIYIRNESESALFLHKGRESVDRVGPGNSHTATFDIEVQEMPEEGHISIDAEIFDTIYNELLSEPLEIAVDDAGEDAAPATARSGHVTVTASRAPVKSQPFAEAEALAEASRSATLPVTRSVSGWYYVTFESGAGWVPEGAVQYHEEPASASNDLIRDRLQFQAPIVELDRETLVTSSDQYPLRGALTDDEEVRDYYISVTTRPDNRRVQRTKRVYELVSAESATIERSVSLSPGLNTITVVARDNDELQSIRSINVYYDAELSNR